MVDHHKYRKVAETLFVAQARQIGSSRRFSYYKICCYETNRNVFAVSKETNKEHIPAAIHGTKELPTDQVRSLGRLGSDLRGWFGPNLAQEIVQAEHFCPRIMKLSGYHLRAHHRPP